MKRERVVTRVPSLAELARQRDKFKCDHLMGRAVIEQCITELALGKMTNDYCQNWDRCPGNGWGKCTPDMKAWVATIQKPEYQNVFSEKEIEIIASLKQQRM